MTLFVVHSAIVGPRSDGEHSESWHHCGPFATARQFSKRLSSSLPLNWSCSASSPSLLAAIAT